MKTTTVQLPIRLRKRVLLTRAGPPRPAGYPRLRIASRDHRYWYAFFRSLRAALSRVLDTSAYDEISLGREVSVAFTAQGPVVYRYGRNSSVDSIPARRERETSRAEITSKRMKPVIG